MARQTELDLSKDNLVVTLDMVNSPKMALAWARERHSIYLKRAAGKPKPWTRDPILSSYRFCNLYRQLDTVSVWIKENIIDRFEDKPYLWYLLAMARSINHVPTLKNIIDARAWDDPDHMYRIMCDMKSRGEQIFTGAYLVNSVFPKDFEGPRTKHYFMAYLNLGKLYENRKEVGPRMNTTMEEAVTALKTQRGYGDFISYQVAVDLSYSDRWLKQSVDLNTYNSPGPGTKRGLNRMYGGGRRQQFETQTNEWYSEKILELYAYFQKNWRVTSDDPFTGYAPVELSNISNTCCESDKISRILLLEGTPRSRYNGQR